MYPATIFNWHDQSEIQTATTSTVDDTAPLFMQVFSADKGSEDLIEIAGTDFDAMYGTMSFSKHGQSAIQAKAIIDAGGRLYAKRVVADDATLANAVLCATVTPANPGVSVKWTSQSISGCKSYEEVLAAAKDLYVEGSVYPLIIYADNGRGTSIKAIRLNPDYATSKTIGKMFYNLSVYESTSITEQITVTFDPSVTYKDTAYGFDKYSTVQITGEVVPEMFDEYVETLAANITSIDKDTLKSSDIVYGYTTRGQAIEGFTLDSESVDLDAELGLGISNGTNGTFGDAPVGTDAWTEAIRKVFAGEFSTDVYDVDRHKVFCICDANYPDAVKKAIYDLVVFREDCVYLRDFGTGLTTWNEIYTKYSTFEAYRSKFVADYCTSYMIRDPQTHKNIEVTMMYDMCQRLVNHFVNNGYAPVCGITNGFILDNPIEGTINFTPVNTPSVNQKELLETARINYAVFEDAGCVVQSNNTSYDKYTQLSYLCNVLAIQTVMRAVRKSCPAQRYTLSSGTDLTEYATAVTKLLNGYTANFNSLSFVYTQDSLRASQKIFYASIEFSFLNWAQTEIFDLYAINE